MVVYACCCLNVRIFAEKIEGKLISDAFQACPLGPTCEAVELVDHGFQFSHKCLVQRVRDRDWTVYVCVPCHMQTHAVNLAARLVAVSSSMKKDDEVIQKMKDNPDYSEVFNLLLFPVDGRQKEDGLNCFAIELKNLEALAVAQLNLGPIFPFAEYAIQPQSYETLQKQLGDLQDVLSKYLKQEEDSLETRIRNYEEEQRNNFIKLKEKAQKEKAKLISVLFHNSEGNHTLLAQDRNSSRAHGLLTHSKSATEYERERFNDFGNGKKNWRIRDSSPDVFAMDELDIEEEEIEGASSISRFENKTTSEDTNNSNVQQFGRKLASELDATDEAGAGQDEIPLMSTSVPISMPAHAQNIRVKSHLDDSFEDFAEFDDIPRNMQALSESIQERDRYIFGDRPRQRVHTGDFTQVNWH